MKSAPLRLDGVIERRLLINYRLDRGVAEGLLPIGLRPQLVDGSAVAGICLIRMRALRPSVLPLPIGWRGEAAAHRIAVEWEDETGLQRGVYIPVRQSASRLPVVLGGRLFPGVHRRAGFEVAERGHRYRIAITGAESVSVEVVASEAWSSSLFPTLQAASDFFQAGSVGWSPDRTGAGLEGLVLDTDAWAVRPAIAISVASTFFSRLPAGSAVLDDALLMTRVPVTWRTAGRRPAVEDPVGVGRGG